MTETKPCPLCKTECLITGRIPYNEIDGSGYRLNCPICGEYSITGRAESYLEVRKENLHIISGVTRNFYWQYKKDFMIEKEMIRDDAKFQAEFVSKMPKSVLEKAFLLLQYVAYNSDGKPSTLVEVTPDDDYSIAFCKDKNELKFYIDYLSQRGLITSKCTAPGIEHLAELVPPSYNVSLTIDGWIEVEKLKTPNIESKQAFVAMWFDPTMEEPFEKGILPLEDETETGFKMFRVDKAQFNDEKICDKIIAEIKRSRFLIADVTGHRQAVYFEAGYAMAMGLPVIWTCKNDNEHTDKCCFDTRQYPHVFWKDADDLKNRLKNKIMADIVKIKK